MDRRQLLLGLGGVAAVPLLGAARPTTYVVSDQPAVHPEGIAVAPDGRFYVTSSATGAVYRGHVDRPRMGLFLPAGGDGRSAAAGVRVDEARRLFVAGYSSGALFVYDRSGRLVARRDAEVPGAALNDLALTPDAVYVTDSATGTVHRAARRGGEVGRLRPWLVAERFDPPAAFLNGIVATGRHLLVSDQGTEVLHRVALDSGEAAPIATDRPMAGDGLLLEGRRLHAVVNRPDGAGGAEFQVRTAVLAPDLASGRTVAESGVATLARTPTTVARDRGRLLWVNSQLGNPAPAPPFTVSEVPY